MLENVLNLFYPKVCFGCSALLISNESVICTRCRHEIPFTLHHQNPNNEAFKKFYGKIPIEFESSNCPSIEYRLSTEHVVNN